MRSLPQVRKVLAGHYQTLDGRWQIMQGFGSDRDWYVFESGFQVPFFAEPRPTLKDARVQLAGYLENA